jgi:hypothetical protein
VFEKSPHKPIKAAALYEQAQMADNKGKKGAADARAMYERLAKEYGDEKPMYGDDNYKALARLVDLRAGQTCRSARAVPDFDATDESGVSSSCPTTRARWSSSTSGDSGEDQCVAMLPHEKELVKRLKEQPFAHDRDQQ